MKHLQHLKPKIYSHLIVKASNWKDGSREAIKRYQDYLEPILALPAEVEELFAHVCHGTNGLVGREKLQKMRRNAEAIFGPEYTPEQRAQMEAEFTKLLEESEVEPFFDELAAAN